MTARDGETLVREREAPKGARRSPLCEHGRSAPGDHQKTTSGARAVIYLPIVWTGAACDSRRAREASTLLRTQATA